MGGGRSEIMGPNDIRINFSLKKNPFVLSHKREEVRDMSPIKQKFYAHPLKVYNGHFKYLAVKEK